LSARFGPAALASQHGASRLVSTSPQAPPSATCQQLRYLSACCGISPPYTGVLLRIISWQQPEASARLLPVERRRNPRSRLGTSPWSLRPGGRSSPSTTGAVGLPGGGDPILLVYWPAAVRLLHAWLGHVHPTKPVGLADIHPCSTFCLMIAILPRLARARTEMPRASLTRDTIKRLIAT
jgi:hypothetical protein